MKQNYRVDKSAALTGECIVPGDKSISHRAIMFSALAEGVSHIRYLLEGEDVLATIAAFRAMGVQIERVGDREYRVHGVGKDGLQAPDQPLDLGNSGTSFRLMMGVLAAQPWAVKMVGDVSLSARPMGRVIAPLEQMGAEIQSNDGKPPVVVNPDSKEIILQSIRYQMPVASAQVKSCVLLAGLYAQGETAVYESAPTRDHTERMLRGFGYEVVREGDWISLSGGGRLQACDVDVPADLSSSAFFMVAASIIEGSDIVLKRVGMNPSRNGIVNLLQRMGANIELSNQDVVGGEPVADIRVRASKLKGIEIAANDVALAIDEMPVLAIAAACATGQTRVSGAHELRVKECDRISCVVNGLRNIGIRVEEYEDGYSIEGGTIVGGDVESHHDHRISMSFAIAGAVSQNGVRVLGSENVATSFPTFVQLAKDVGIPIEVEQA